ncbi:MAG: DegT/DnrJ/EryC1/StrS family aminotransferase [Desulfobulbaceae bacterium]|nr:DegT/DnrJ/EryC1/StrS family aminotransferase [Desulfobulbaceae bacterium]
MKYVPSPNHPLAQAFPYFPPEEQEILVEEFKQILNGILSMGPRVADFEKRFASYCGANFSVAFPSCTSSLEAALQALNVGPGDEVLVPVQTFIATGMAVHLTGATPVFTEVSYKHFSMDFEDAWSKVGSKTKGAIVVHFGGHIASDLDIFCKKMKESGRFVVEDCAHAHGSRLNGRHAGTFGDAGCFSFFPTKMMTTGEGGMLITSNQDIAKIARSLQNRGQDMDSTKELYILPGRNNRVSEIAAAMGISQLRCLNSFLEKRREVAKTYDKLLSEDGTYFPMLSQEGVASSYWKYIAIAKHPFFRETLQTKLAKDGIAVNWAYAPPLHLQPVCQELFGCRSGMLPFSEELMSRHLCLPIHQNMRPVDAEYVIDRLLTHTKAL